MGDCIPVLLLTFISQLCCIGSTTWLSLLYDFSLWELFMHLITLSSPELLQLVRRSLSTVVVGSGCKLSHIEQYAFFGS
jgi:hypothetical protein